MVGWYVRSYLGPSKITSFSNLDFSQSNKHDTFWHVASTGYSHILFLWATAVSEFCPLEIYNNLGLPLSTISFTVNSHADNRFYKYICFKYYTVWNLFFIKIHVKVLTKIFYIQIWFKCETSVLFFLANTMVYRKNLFIQKNRFFVHYVKNY